MTQPASVNSAGSPLVRRLRITFTKGEEVRYISHLDLMRTWERILRRAGIKLAHTQGFNPRPRLIFAAPLSVGITSEAEFLDVYIDNDLGAAQFEQLVQTAVPPGVRVTGVADVRLDEPPLMACAYSSDYVVELEAPVELEQLVYEFLARGSVPYERARRGAVKQADMRPAVLDLWLDKSRSSATVGMRLRLDVEGQAVRPEEVVRALDPDARVLRVHRTALHLKGERPREHAA